MGTTGSGKFKDYLGGKGESGKGGPEDKDLCSQEIESITLEEVANCEYYKTNNDLPVIGTVVTLRGSLVSGRLAIDTTKGELLGYLPTQLNYLRACIEEGFSYTGHVLVSSVQPIPNIQINLAP